MMFGLHMRHEIDFLSVFHLFVHNLKHEGLSLHLCNICHYLKRYHIHLPPVDTLNVYHSSLHSGEFPYLGCCCLLFCYLLITDELFKRDFRIMTLVFKCILKIYTNNPNLLKLSTIKITPLGAVCRNYCLLEPLTVPLASYNILSFCPNCGGKLTQCSAFTDVGRRWLGTTCCEWIAAHIHKSFVDQGDKAGAHSMTGRLGLGNGGQETTALRPKDRQRVMRASSHRGYCPNCQREGGEERKRGRITTLEGKLAASP